MSIRTEEIIKKTKTNTFVYGYAYDDKLLNVAKKLIYIINKRHLVIIYYPYNPKYLFFDRISLDGFDELPEIFKKNGYSKNGIFDRINKNFGDKGVKSITVHRSGKAYIIRRKSIKHLHIPYSTLGDISDELGSMDFHNRKLKSHFVNQKLHDDFPKLIKLSSRDSISSEIKKSIQNLYSQDIKNFDREDIKKITQVLSNLMKSSYRSQIAKSELFKTTKVQIDTVTLDDVIQEFDQKLGRSTTSESDWGKFLESNLFLIDSKYIHALPQLNLVLAGARKVDFGLVDIQGYLDLFEIKKPQTKLLTDQKDSRGNYEWNKQAIEAIVQAEKYLLHADTKRATLKEDIKREREIELDIIRPRAFVIMGSSSQLDSESKKGDFRMLKNQFKNIEIILYDELLERIKNQKKSLES